MAYKWSLEGPTFEFPTPFGTENRFLTLRGYLLIGSALVVLLIVAFVGKGSAGRPALVLDALSEPASAVPHLLCALLLAGLGALDLWQAAGQSMLLLTPGRPASLSSEVAREASGTAPGAPALQRVLESGAVSQGQLGGPYEGWLRALGDDLAAAPRTLHAYLRQRLAHLLLAGGLLVVLAVGAAVAMVAQLPASLALMGLPPLLLGGVVLVRQMLLPAERAAPAPLMLAGVLVGVLVVSAAVAWFAPGLPRADVFPRLGLTVAAAVMLVCVIVTDLLGIVAARPQIQTPWLPPTLAEEAKFSFDSDPELLLRGIDLELHRQWAEGIPNRRYAWQPPHLAHSGEVGEFTTVLLEESQPLVPQDGKHMPPLAEQVPAQRRPLLLLDTLGLLLTVAGAGLWVWAAYAHMRDSRVSWLSSSTGLVCLLVGGYAMRVAHVLWSRVEVRSTLTWLDFKGSYFRQAAAAEGAGRTRVPAQVHVDDMLMHARVASARSVFYAATPHYIGSRVLLELAPERAAAQAWVALVREFARKAAPGEGAAPGSVRARARHHVAEQEAEPVAPVAAVKRAARFCSACGTPVLAGARFCQHCGHTLAP